MSLISDGSISLDSTFKRLQIRAQIFLCLLENISWEGGGGRLNQI
jgi:hypothetical protein